MADAREARGANLLNRSCRRLSMNGYPLTLGRLPTPKFMSLTVGRFEGFQGTGKTRRMSRGSYATLTRSVPLTPWASRLHPCRNLRGGQTLYPGVKTSGFSHYPCAWSGGNGDRRAPGAGDLVHVRSLSRSRAEGPISWVTYHRDVESVAVSSPSVVEGGPKLMGNRPALDTALISWSKTSSAE